jgi:5'-nucleotidase
LKKNLSREIIKKVARDPILEFRKDSQQLLEELDKKNIPLIFMSAGMGDILVELLKENNLKLKNIQVISNFLEFNDKGIAIKIKSEVIHALNKKEITLKGLPEYEKLLKRKNVISWRRFRRHRNGRGIPIQNIIKIGS